ncbi:MAG: AAA family ATPase, partial [Syntrophales bacterium]|nr:AAA family ATPase [Syntrophales bacterium]
MDDLNQKFPPQQLNQVRIAGIYLFGPQRALESDFINKLSLETIKKAFRAKARRLHPDLQSNQSADLVEKNRQWFIKVKESYEILKDFVTSQTFEPEPTMVRSKRIIAVGGAKGGIGKSTFTTNLGVFLASQGHRTVMVDLDLGGANLHLYLGKTFIKTCINDYVNRSVPSLKDLMLSTKFGPWLIGGDSSQLGSANISFSAKMKLIKSLREMDADYVILDLGSNTSFNILDFFLAADSNVVVTTCEPASYLEAYNFIKVGLLRRLNRLFGEETPDAGKKNLPLQQLIHEATMSPNGAKAKNIPALLARVKAQHPDYLPLLQKALETYQPFLVVNQVIDVQDVAPIVRRIQEVSRKMLAIRVRYLGILPYLETVKRSTLELVPEV